MRHGTTVVAKDAVIDSSESLPEGRRCDPEWSGGLLVCTWLQDEVLSEKLEEMSSRIVSQARLK